MSVRWLACVGPLGFGVLASCGSTAPDSGERSIANPVPRVGVDAPEWPVCADLVTPMDLTDPRTARDAYQATNLDFERLIFAVAGAQFEGDPDCPVYASSDSTTTMGGDCWTEDGAQYWGTLTLGSGVEGSAWLSATGFEFVSGAKCEYGFEADGYWWMRSPDGAFGAAEEWTQLGSTELFGPDESESGRRTDESELACADDVCLSEGRVGFVEFAGLSGEFCYASAIAGGTLPDEPQRGTIRLVGSVRVELRVLKGSEWWYSLEEGAWTPI